MDVLYLSVMDQLKFVQENTDNYSTASQHVLHSLVQLTVMAKFGIFAYGGSLHILFSARLVAVQFTTPPIPMYLYGLVTHFPCNLSPWKLFHLGHFI